MRRCFFHSLWVFVFLTDFIEGDVYYKTSYPDHNLVRSRAQLKLALDGEQKLKDMQQINSAHCEMIVIKS